jgi:hypothetical protein
VAPNIFHGAKAELWIGNTKVRQFDVVEFKGDQYLWVGGRVPWWKRVLSSIHRFFKR